MTLEEIKRLSADVVQKQNTFPGKGGSESIGELERMGCGCSNP